MDRTHNPEFTMLELYVAYQDYHWMMETIEQLLRRSARRSTGQPQPAWRATRSSLRLRTAV